MSDREGFDIAALRALADNATPGPWGFGGSGVAALDDSLPEPRIAITDFGGYESDLDVLALIAHSRSNGEFIAAARSALPWCLDHIEELEAFKVAYINKSEVDESNRLSQLGDLRDEFEHCGCETVDALVEAVQWERARVAALQAALGPLISIAETYAMQSYDRSGTTRRAIDAARVLLRDQEVTT